MMNRYGDFELGEGGGGGNDPPWNNLDLVEAENQNDFFIGLFFARFTRLKML